MHDLVHMTHRTKNCTCFWIHPPINMPWTSAATARSWSTELCIPCFCTKGGLSPVLFPPHSCAISHVLQRARAREFIWYRVQTPFSPPLFYHILYRTPTSYQDSGYWISRWASASPAGSRTRDFCRVLKQKKKKVCHQFSFHLLQVSGIIPLFPPRYPKWISRDSLPLALRMNHPQPSPSLIRCTFESCWNLGSGNQIIQCSPHSWISMNNDKDRCQVGRFFS